LLVIQAGWLARVKEDLYQLHRLSGVSDFPAITC
jgi:hypothetical protein